MISSPWLAPRVKFWTDSRMVFLEVIQRRILLAGENSAKARNTEHLFIGIHGFGNAIAKRMSVSSGWSSTRDVT